MLDESRLRDVLSQKDWISIGFCFIFGQAGDLPTSASAGGMACLAFRALSKGAPLEEQPEASPAASGTIIGLTDPNRSKVPLFVS